MRLLITLQRWILIGLVWSYVLPASGQAFQFSRADSLRGTLSEYRSCYDVRFYHLDLRVDPDTRTIRGSNMIRFEVVHDFKTLQVDLFDNMTMESVDFEGRKLAYSREHHAVFITFPETLKAGQVKDITIRYAGQPIIAKRPPWDGGFVWKSDLNGRPWIGVACEGTGASLWWPNKDHLSDEPDSMRISCAVPPGLQCIANGQLIGVEIPDTGFVKYHWKVSYPINNYNVTLNIGDYEHFSDRYVSGQDTLDLDYYVLSYNKERAMEHFGQVKPMLKCFENYFGPYPFHQDGFALVETSYWGMEHQGAIAYGNNYRNNDFGFDFIIIHESGHEWWGNSLSCRDHAEMWIHESFTTYAEALYVECLYGFDRSVEYLMTQRDKIVNEIPILGALDVNFQAWPAADMYYKGTWMLHTLRHVVDDDTQWFELLKGLTRDFKRSNLTTPQIIAYIGEKTGQDHRKFFEQYLTDSKAPTLTYHLERKKGVLYFSYRWDDVIPGFNMPVKVTAAGGLYTTIYPKPGKWERLEIRDLKKRHFKIADHLFYILPNRLKKLE